MMLNRTGIDSRSDEEPREEVGEEAVDVQLAIKLNYEGAEYVCAVCGDERISTEGAELFLADTWDLVCDECGRRYAPLLMALIDLGAAAEGYAAVRDVAALKDEQAKSG